MKEIKIMGRADFAGDVALWIFFILYIYIYIYLSVYIYIYLSSLSLPLWASFRLPASRVSTNRATVGCLYLRVVRDASGLSFPDSPVVRRLWASVLLLHLAAQPRAFSSPSSSSLRGSPLLSRRKRTTYPLLRFSTVFRVFIRFRFMTASSSCVAARGHRVYPAVSSFSFIVGRARKSHAGAFAPPAPLRVTGICKSIYL